MPNRVCLALAKLSLALLLLALALFCTPAAAQTYSVLHNFTGGNDGAYPQAGVTLDRAGNLYGTASMGGDNQFACPQGCGTVFKLSRSGQGWLLNPLYIFAGTPDGSEPRASVAIATDGSLYSTTASGGTAGYGVAFQLQPSAAACKSALCPWTETVLHSFDGNGDGRFPVGTLTFDASGNLYGVTEGGGQSGGVVYQLQRGMGWPESVLFDGLDLSNAGVIFDRAGNLYGTTISGGANNKGSVFELEKSGGNWTLTTLYSFSGSDGAEPMGGLVMDAAGNLYGTTSTGGVGNGGTVFELSPQGGGWSLSTLYAFAAHSGQPLAGLAMDVAGNLYGTTNDRTGSVFELSPSAGGWTFTTLHSFSGGDGGENPSFAGVTVDANGNVYGTTAGGGSGSCPGGCGVVFEIAP